MRKTKKTIIVLFLCVACVLAAFSGCHSAVVREEYTIPAEFDTSRQYELTFWAKSDTNLTQVNIYKQTVADFEALYPNIKITLRVFNNYNDIYNEVITNIATDTTPNICISYPDHIATYMEGSNTVVPLDELLTDERYGLGGSQVRFDAPTMDQIVPKFLEEGRIGQHYYAMPYMRSTEACYINKTYVEALGYELPEMLTWDFIWEVSEAATAKNPDGTFAVNGQNVLIPFIYKSTDNMMIQMLKQKGAGYSTENGDILIFNDTTKQLLYTVADHVKTRAFSTFKISSYPGDYLNAGQCIFAVDSTAGATWMGPHAPLMDIAADKIVDFEVAVMEIPQFDTANPQMISQGPSMCLFNKADEQEVLASWLFMQYLLTNDVQIAYSQTEGYVPVTSKAQDSTEYQEYLSRAGEDNNLYYDVKIQASQLMLRNMDNTFVTPVFSGSASLRDAAGQMIENVTKSIRRKQTVDEAYMEKLFAEMVSLFRLDQTAAADIDVNQFDGLPPTAVILLICIGAAWIVMGVFVATGSIKRKIKRKKY